MNPYDLREKSQANGGFDGVAIDPAANWQVIVVQIKTVEVNRAKRNPRHPMAALVEALVLLDWYSPSMVGKWSYYIPGSNTNDPNRLSIDEPESRKDFLDTMPLESTKNGAKVEDAFGNEVTGAVDLAKLALIDPSNPMVFLVNYPFSARFTPAQMAAEVLAGFPGSEKRNDEGEVIGQKTWAEYLPPSTVYPIEGSEDKLANALASSLNLDLIRAGQMKDAGIVLVDEADSKVITDKAAPVSDEPEEPVRVMIDSPEVIDEPEEEAATTDTVETEETEETPEDEPETTEDPETEKPEE